MPVKISTRIPVKFARHMSDEEIRSENEVVDLAKKDAQEFGKLYDRYFEDIFYFIYRRTDDEMISADLTSQTFYQALKKLKSYESRGLPFSAWLFRIATNEVNKLYRSRKTRRIYSLEESRVKEIMEESGEPGNEENLAALISALNDLPTEVVEIMELRFFEEKSFKEIAFILEISESSAKMRIYRTLDKLRKVILTKNRDGKA